MVRMRLGVELARLSLDDFDDSYHVHSQQADNANPFKPRVQPFDPRTKSLVSFECCLQTIIKPTRDAGKTGNVDAVRCFYSRSVRSEVSLPRLRIPAAGHSECQ